MATKQKSAIIAATGFVAAVWTEIVNAVRERGGTDEDIHRLATSEGRPLIGKFADLIVGAATMAFTVTVNYAQSLSDMVTAGKYDWVNDNIAPKNFPMNGAGIVERELHLIHLNRVVSTSDAEAELDRRGFNSAAIEDILTLGATHPELQLQFPVVALGSRWRYSFGDWRVPVLCMSGRRRNLDLYWLEYDWSEDYRFLTVRKS